MTENGARQQVECPGAVLGAGAAMKLLQARHALGIVRALRSGPLRFNALGRAAGVPSATTLHARLDALRGAGVLDHDGGTYRLTASGEALSGVFDAIDTFTRRYPHHDPHSILKALQRRYAMRVMRELRHGELGFNELYRATAAASATTLTRRLDDLETLGLIRKTTHSTMPPRTTYAHSAIGRDFSPVVGHIVGWGESVTWPEANDTDAG